MVLEPQRPTESITSAWLQPTRPGDLAHGADPHQGLLAPAVPFVLIPVQGSIQLTQPPSHAHPATHPRGGESFKQCRWARRANDWRLGI